MGVCGQWSTAQPSQNKKIEKRRGEEQETEGRKNSMSLLKNDELGTGEEFPFNAIPQLAEKDDTKNPNQ